MNKLRVSLSVAIGLSLGSVALAKATLPGFTYISPTGANVVWRKLPIQICAAADVPKIIVSHLAPAAAVWNDTFRKEIFQIGCALTNSNYVETNQAEHGIYWITADFETHTDKTSLARTILQYDDDGAIRDGDILLNGQYYDWNKLSIDPQTVLVHELGHLLGMKHFFLSPSSAMNYYPYVGGYEHRNLGEYEQLVFRTLYQNLPPKIAPYLSDYFNGNAPAALTKLAAQKNKSAEDYFALGVLYKAAKQTSAARDSFKAALQRLPNLVYLRQQYAEALWANGELDKAEAEFQRVLKTSPRSYEALANLGGLRLARGDKKQAASFLQRSLEIQPAHWVACAMLFKLTKEARYQHCVDKYGPIKTTK